MNIPYDYYKTFYYVALYRSFTKAAEIMLANQPNVTRTIKNLEMLLGCRLFVRSNRSVSLTPEGEKAAQLIADANQNFYKVAFRRFEDNEKRVLQALLQLMLNNLDEEGE